MMALMKAKLHAGQLAYICDERRQYGVECGNGADILRCHEAILAAIFIFASLAARVAD
jgi:hypothetical protein